MKYMTFRSSCAYAGVANLLEQYGVDVRDRDLAMGMHLPLLFDEQDGSFLAGPSMQSAAWFNLFLNPIGFQMEERCLPHSDIPMLLQGGEAYMLGIAVSPQDKHAVISRGMRDGKYLFLNNRWEHTEEPDALLLTEPELLARLDAAVMTARLVPCEKQTVDVRGHVLHSLQVLARLRREICRFCGTEQTKESLLAAMDPLFRAVLLDGVTMLELAGQQALMQKLISVRTELLQAIPTWKCTQPQAVISLPTLLGAIDDYAAWIAAEEERM